MKYYRAKPTVPKFQFQNGTINSDYKWKKAIMNGMFQFQNGTINSGGGVTDVETVL